MTRIAGTPPREVTRRLVADWFMDKRGTPCPADLALFESEAQKVGVNWLGLFCMAIVETGYFTSYIYKTKRNMFGLGAVDSDPEGGAASFDNNVLAVRAGAEHLAVYGGLSTVKNRPASDFVLERTAKLRDWGYSGIVTHFLDLGGKTSDGKVKWASNPEHGMQVENLIFEIVDHCGQRNPLPDPDPAPLPSPIGNFWNVLISALKYLHPILAKVNPWLGWIAFGAYTLLDYFF